MNKTLAELNAALPEIQAAPSLHGEVKLIVRRPSIETREVIAEGLLDPVAGLVGDCWSTRGSGQTADGAAHPDAQITIMNARAIAVMAESIDRWPLAGDQLYVDHDVSVTALPIGCRISVGMALIEITEKEHTGCVKFAGRFGADALRFVSTPVGRQLRLRGVYAKVLKAGVVRTGDRFERLPVPSAVGATLSR